jgi:hypothetical protein
MRDEIFPDAGASGPSALDRRLHAIDTGPIPDDLLARCLATIPASDRAPAIGPRRPAGWRLRATAAAAVLLIGAAAFMARPRTADAALLLKAVGRTWTEVPASHCVQWVQGPEGTRREETWFVRDKGQRKEVRVQDELIGVVVRNRRWEFRWDLPGRIVAAWSTELATGHSRYGQAGLVPDSQAMVRWAEAHRAEIRVEAVTVEGRAARKIALRWPGPAGEGSLPRTETIWIDPDSLRPVKLRMHYDDGRSIETRIDYPAVEAVAADLFAFRPPPDVVLEINDPDLGRQIYSEGRAPRVGPDTHDPRGGQR